MKPTLLTKEQIFGDNALEIMKWYGVRASASDLAIIFGAFLSRTGKDCEGHPAVSYWTASAAGHGDVVVVDTRGCVSGYQPCYRDIACRPVLSPDVTSKIPQENVKLLGGINGVQIVEYGEYPQTAVDKALSARLDDMLMRGVLWVGNKTYTFDAVSKTNDSTPIFKAYNEYILDNKCYLCVDSRVRYARSFALNGMHFKPRQKYWVRVEPIKWLADPCGWWVSKDCLIAGIRFNPDVYYDGDFEKTDIASYMEDYFAPPRCGVFGNHTLCLQWPGNSLIQNPNKKRGVGPVFYRVINLPLVVKIQSQIFFSKHFCAFRYPYSVL